MTFPTTDSPAVPSTSAMQTFTQPPRAIMLRGQFLNSKTYFLPLPDTLAELVEKAKQHFAIPPGKVPTITLGTDERAIVVQEAMPFIRDRELLTLRWDLDNVKRQPGNRVRWDDDSISFPAASSSSSSKSISPHLSSSKPVQDPLATAKINRMINRDPTLQFGEGTAARQAHVRRVLAKQKEHDKLRQQQQQLQQQQPLPVAHFETQDVIETTPSTEIEIVTNPSSPSVPDVAASSLVSPPRKRHSESVPLDTPPSSGSSPHHTSEMKRISTILPKQPNEDEQGSSLIQSPTRDLSSARRKTSITANEIAHVLSAGAELNKALHHEDQKASNHHSTCSSDNLPSALPQSIEVQALSDSSDMSVKQPSLAEKKIVVDDKPTMETDHPVSQALIDQGHEETTKTLTDPEVEKAYKYIENLVSQLLSHGSNTTFQSAMSEPFQEFSKRYSRPVDLHTIRCEILAHNYGSSLLSGKAAANAVISGFEDDLSVMYSNARKYFGLRSAQTQCADHLETFSSSFISEWKRSNHSSSNTTHHPTHPHHNHNSISGNASNSNSSHVGNTPSLPHPPANRVLARSVGGGSHSPSLRQEKRSASSSNPFVFGSTPSGPNLPFHVQVGRALGIAPNVSATLTPSRMLLEPANVSLKATPRAWPATMSEATEKGPQTMMTVDQRRSRSSYCAPSEAFERALRGNNAAALQLSPQLTTDEQTVSSPQMTQQEEIQQQPPSSSSEEKVVSKVIPDEQQPVEQESVQATAPENEAELNRDNNLSSVNEECQSDPNTNEMEEEEDEEFSSKQVEKMTEQSLTKEPIDVLKTTESITTIDFEAASTLDGLTEPSTSTNHSNKDIEMTQQDVEQPQQSEESIIIHDSQDVSQTEEENDDQEAVKINTATTTTPAPKTPRSNRRNSRVPTIIEDDSESESPTPPPTPHRYSLRPPSPRKWKSTSSKSINILPCKDTTLSLPSPTPPPSSSSSSSSSFSNSGKKKNLQLTLKESFTTTIEKNKNNNKRKKHQNSSSSKEPCLKRFKKNYTPTTIDDDNSSSLDEEYQVAKSLLIIPQPYFRKLRKQSKNKQEEVVGFSGSEKKNVTPKKSFKRKKTN